MNLRKDLQELQPLPLDERGFPCALVLSQGDVKSALRAVRVA